MNHNPFSLNEEETGEIIPDSAFKVHSSLGPGLLESIYEAASEHFHQSCSAGLKVLTDSGLLGFRLRFRSVTGSFKPAPSQKPRQKPKILTAHRYIFSVNALAIEISKHGLSVEKQKPISVEYDGHLLDVAFRADLIVNNLVLIELKSVEAIRVCLKIPRGAVYEQRAGWRGATRKNTHPGSSTEEQRSQSAFCSKTLRAAGLLPVGRVGSVVTARCGDAPPSPPCPQPKSLAAAPLAILRQTLTPLFKKITTNYLKLIQLRLEVLINFNETYLKNGILRVTNGLEGKDFFRPRVSRTDLKNSSPTSRPSRDT